MEGWDGPREARKTILDSRQAYLDRRQSRDREGAVYTA
jgi:hypothetical protein